MWAQTEDIYTYDMIKSMKHCNVAGWPQQLAPITVGPNHSSESGLIGRARYSSTGAGSDRKRLGDC